MGAPWPRRGVWKVSQADAIMPAWFVPSKSHPGLFHQVTTSRARAQDPIGFTCTGCPRADYLSDHGRVVMVAPHICSHVRQALEADADDGQAPRPQAPMHPGLADPR